MGEKAIHILAPAQGKMDHIFSSIQFVHSIAKSEAIRANRLFVTFFPLNEIAQVNLPKFLNAVRSRMGNRLGTGKNEWEVEIEYAVSQVIRGTDWASVVDMYMHSQAAKRKNMGTFVVLGNEPLVDITLQTSIASLSHPRIKLIRIPVGYDLQTPPPDFNPEEKLSKQVQEMPLLGGNEIRKPLLEIARNPVVCEALLAIRSLEDRNDSEHDGHKPNQIISQINDDRKASMKRKELKSSAFSNNIAPLKKHKLIDTESSLYKLTPLGKYLSGLLKDNGSEAEGVEGST